MIAALTTLAPWLLGFAGAAAIPVLVHLISRSRHREVKWGAMHLIELTLQQKQNRMRVENWLLMLLRCLLPLLLFSASPHGIPLPPLPQSSVSSY